MPPSVRTRIAVRQWTEWTDSKNTSRSNQPHAFKKVDLDKTIRELEYELGMMDVESAEVWHGFDGRNTRRDAWPLQNLSGGHPGIVLTYTHPKHGVIRIATDNFYEWTANLRAILLTVENLRQMERFGTTGNGKQWEGFRQLPSSTGSTMDVQRAAEVVKEHGKSRLSVDVILREREVADMVSTAARYATHPDRNPGKADATEVFQLVEQARAALSKHHGGF